MTLYTKWLLDKYEKSAAILLLYTSVLYMLRVDNGVFEYEQMNSSSDITGQEIAQLLVAHSLRV